MIKGIMTTKKQRDMMLHALGRTVDAKSNYRNYYSASEGCDGFKELLDLVEKGLMVKKKSTISPDMVFHVTDEGRHELGFKVVLNNENSSAS